MSQLKIYKASAGSGKTFTLTREFLFLLYANPNNYANTLAVTFTNKATSEMKSRILEKLFEISTHKTNDYVSDLMAEFSLSETQVRAKADVLLSYLLHDFSNFSVSTIDSFFQKVIRSFAREAGLESGYKIELKTDKILQKAVVNLLMKVDLPEYKHLKQWLIAFAEQKLSDGKSWNLTTDLNKLGMEIFNELFQIDGREMLTAISNKETLQQYLSDIQKIIKEFDTKTKELGTKGSTLIKDSGLIYDQFTGKSRTPLKYFEKLKKIKDAKDIQPTNTLLKLIDQTEKWGHKDNSPEVNLSIANIAPTLNSIIKEAFEFIAQNSENYFTAKVIEQNYFALGIVADIAKEVQEICRNENIFLISDSSHFLNKIIDSNETPFIYEKIGTRFQHFMIDEFQDTSKLQWLNFRPLVANSLADNNCALIVGDVKQSIYRWRNSDWNLLANKVENDFMQHGSTQFTLNKNWRSLSNIIGFNNSLFVEGAKLVQNSFNNQLLNNVDDDIVINELKEKISKAYDDVFQELPSNKALNQGQIKCKFLPQSKEHTYNELMLPELVAEIEMIISKGYRYSDICVLVRKKDEGETIANALLSGEYSASGNVIPVISNESLFLSGSSAVNYLMAQIKYLRSPNDLIIKTEVALSAKLIFEDNSDNTQIEIGKYFDYSSETSFDKHDPDWSANLLSLRQKPLQELVEILANKLPQKIKAEQGVFIQAFINHTNNFIKDSYSDLTAFVNWWDESGTKETVAVPDDQDAIRIMTIHKSKGLEFNVVVIPYCNWKLRSEIMNDIIWCRPNIAPFNAIELLPINFSQKLHNTIFKNDYFNELLYQNVDSLNLLYVALTRCCEVLITFGDKPKETKDEIKSVSELMYLTITNHQFTSNEGFIDLATSWNSEDNEFIYGEAPTPKESKKESSIENELLLPFANRILTDKNIVIKTESLDYFESDNHSQIDYGKIMHEAFEYIVTAADVENALLKLLFEGKITHNEKDALKLQIEQLIAKPEVADWFNADYVIKSEASIISKNGIHRPDRVVITPTQTIVIDYKFGNIEEPKYIKQVQQYLQQIKSMGQDNVCGFIWYVSLDKIVEVGK